MFLYEFVSVRMNAMYMVPAAARRNTGSLGAAVSAGGSHLTKPWELNSRREPSNSHPQFPFGHCIFSLSTNASEDEQCATISRGWGNGSVGNVLAIQRKDLSSDPSTNLKAGNGTCAYSHSTGKTQTEISPGPTG